MHAAILHKSTNALIVIFAFLTVSLCTGGYILYLHQKKMITLEKHNELAAINKLKIEQIVNWRHNLMSNAKTIYYNQTVITHIQEFELGINQKPNHQTISNWTGSLLKEFEYTKVLLVNPSGKVIINTNRNEPLTDTGKRIIAQAIQKKDIVISDFSWYNDKTICIYLAVPLYMEPDKRKGFSGVALLNIDPKKYLYPIFHS